MKKKIEIDKTVQTTKIRRSNVTRNWIYTIKDSICL